MIKEEKGRGNRLLGEGESIARKKQKELEKEKKEERGEG